MVFTMATSQLEADQSYLFRVAVSAPFRSTVYAGQVIHLMSGDATDISIICSRNCAPALNPDEKLTLYARCNNCEQNEILTYIWHFAATDIGGRNFSFVNDTFSGKSQSQMVVKQGVFIPGDTKIYTFSVIVFRANGVRGGSEYKFSINRPPMEGQCLVSPSSGQSLQTEFNIVCENFQDENGPLIYEFSFFEPGKDSSVILYIGLSNELLGQYLPPGGSNNGHQLELMVTVYDVYKASVRVTTTVIVIPPSSVSSPDLVALIDGENSGNAQGARALVGTVAAAINSHESTNSPEVQSMQEVRNKLLTSLNTIEGTDMEAVRQTSSVLCAITAKQQELTNSARVSGSQISNNAAVAMAANASAMTTSDLNQLAKSLISSTANLLTYDGNVTNVNVTSPEKSREVILSAIAPLSSIKTALLKQKVPGEEPTEVDTGGIVMSVGYSTTHGPQGVDTKTGGGVLLNLGPGYENATFCLIVYRRNPFSWNNTNSENVASAIDFTLSLDGIDVVPNLTSPVDVMIEVGTDRVVNFTIEKFSARIVAHLSFNVIETDTGHVIMCMDIRQSVSEFVVYVKREEKATPKQFQFYVISDVRSTLKSTTGQCVTFRPEQVNEAGNYHVAITMPRGPVGTHTMYAGIVRASCMYWNPVYERWTSDCELGRKSSTSLTQCHCSHLSTFGNKLFVIPIQLNIAEDIMKFADIMNNAVVLVTLIVVLIVCIPITIWARRADRRDDIRAGVFELEDNSSRARYSYVVTVCTGARYSSGTSANITIILIGEFAESEPHLLTDIAAKDIQLYQTGGVDSVVLRTDVDLGQIIAIRIWHDQSGSHPNWYLSHVVLQDCQDVTSTSIFMCNTWLAINIGDGVLDRTFPVSNDQNLKKFENLFYSKTSSGFRDDHPWFSIITRPPRSTFTRVQRTACCLTLVLSVMLTNIMFHGIAEDPTTAVSLDLGNYRFEYTAFIIGVESSLLVFPLNLFIVQIFRLSRPREKTEPKENDENFISATASVETAQLDTSEADVRKEQLINEQQTTELETSEVDVNKEPLRNVQRTHKSVGILDWKLLLMYKFLVMDSSRDISLPELQDLIKLLSAYRIRKTKSTPGNKNKHKRIIREKNINWSAKPSTTEPSAERSAVMDLWRSLASKARAQQILVSSNTPAQQTSVTSNTPAQQTSVTPYIHVDLSQVSLEMKDSFQTAASSLFDEDIKTRKRRINKLCGGESSLLLPWFCVYIGWIFVIMTSLMCAFFTLLYGLSYGRAKSYSWLTALIQSTTLDFLILQPVKIIIISLVVSFVWRKFTNRYLVSNSLVRLVKTAPRNVDRSVLLAKRLRNQRFYRPPAVRGLLKARQHILQQTRLVSVLTEIVASVLYLALILNIAYLQTDDQAFYLKNSISNNVFHAADIDFSAIYLYKDVWQWLNSSFVDALYDQDDSGFMGTGGSSYRVGAPRLRQLRSKTSGVNRLLVDGTVITNSPRWQDTANYQFSWQTEMIEAVDDTTLTRYEAAWLYRSELYLQGVPIYTDKGWRSGGGYVASLGPDKITAKAMFEHLYTTAWIDNGTDTVFVEFTVYNVNRNLFAVSTGILEYRETGGVFPEESIDILRLYRYSSIVDIVVLAFEITFCLILLYRTVREALKMWKQNYKYFCSFWNVIEFLILLCSYGIIVIYICLYFETNVITDKVRNGTEYISFTYASLVILLLNSFMACLVLLGTLKFLNLLRFYPHIFVLMTTIRRSLSLIAANAILIVLTFVAFAFLAVLQFGTNDREYKDMWVAFTSLFSMIIGQYDQETLLKYNGFITVFLFITSFMMITNWFVLNLFIAGFMKKHEEVRAGGQPHEDTELILLMWQRAGELLGIEFFKAEPHTDNKSSPLDLPHV